jgi:acylphosphatase
MTTEAYIAVVSGHVQGVGFRYTTTRVAQRLGLAGWVRNRVDGTVEVWAQGPAEHLTELSTFLRHGPTGARVTAVELEPTDPNPALTSFEVRTQGLA